MRIDEPERLLREMIAEAETAKRTEASREKLVEGLFAQKEWPQPPKAPFPKPEKKADRRGDITLAALGVTLGLICALFPWYIFYNPVPITTHGMRMGGKGTGSGRIAADQQAGAGAPLTAEDIPAMDVDLFATGTVAEMTGDKKKAPGPDEQPFPADPEFRLVHVANGRAMIEDDTGLWIVQRGSTLPDQSHVSAIEQRAGKWVLVTSNDQVIELSK